MKNQTYHSNASQLVHVKQTSSTLFIHPQPQKQPSTFIPKKGEEFTFQAHLVLSQTKHKTER